MKVPWSCSSMAASTEEGGAWLGIGSPMGSSLVSTEGGATRLSSMAWMDEGAAAWMLMWTGARAFVPADRGWQGFCRSGPARDEAKVAFWGF